MSAAHTKYEELLQQSNEQLNLTKKEIVKEIVELRLRSISEKQTTISDLKKLRRTLARINFVQHNHLNKG
jgi:ribosomal protein L29